MPKQTQGQVEDEFTRAIITFEKEYLGRGPVEARTFFIDDMILIRLKGILTPAEMKLCETPDGLQLVKQTRRQLFESAFEILEQIVHDVTGLELISLHTDMSTQTGERIVVLTVDQDLTTRYA